MYQYDPQVYKQAIDLVVGGWKDAEDNGVQIPGQGLVFPVVLGNKGDWSYLVSLSDRYLQCLFLFSHAGCR